MPTGAQDQAGSHGLALKPGLHSVLHWAYPLSLRKHWWLDSIQQPLWEQSSLLFAHTWEIHGAAPSVRGPNVLHDHKSGSLPYKSGPGVQDALQDAHNEFFWKHCMPGSEQHCVDLQSSLWPEHRPDARLPGVRWPMALHCHQAADSWSKMFGPAEHVSKHSAQKLFFEKHCKPASLQHWVFMQSSPTAEHFACSSSCFSLTPPKRSHPLPRW
mmetsp:Transcript_127927/g.358130  ORF Transcript_127927/g.358130 Transcript_127927/m.358130 type:complete len:213 (-) Transcript_127927:590-1228(-)